MQPAHHLAVSVEPGKGSAGCSWFTKEEIMADKHWTGYQPLAEYGADIIYRTTLGLESAKHGPVWSRLAGRGLRVGI
jgi:hypothetical protein